MDPNPENGVYHPRHIVKLARLVMGRKMGHKISAAEPLPCQHDSVRYRKKVMVRWFRYLTRRYQRSGHSTSSGSFADLVVNHPKVFVLRTLGRDRVKLWGTIRAREPAFRWWLASGNTNWHQDTQLATMPMEDCDIGDPAFDEENCLEVTCTLLLDLLNPKKREN